MSDRRASRGQPDRVSGGGGEFDLLADEVVPALVARLRASGLAELEVRRDGWRVRLRRDLRSPRRPARGAPAEAADEASPDEAAAGRARSPAVGYFNPAPSLRVGHTVQLGDPLGDVDVLGIAVEVSAPASGLVSAVLVEAGQAVEYGEVLAEIEALAEADA